MSDSASTATAAEATTVTLPSQQQHNKKKVCPLTTAEVEAVCASFGTPVQLYDEASIRGQVRRLYAAFQTGAGFTDFRNFFAVKALPNPAVLAVVRAAGCGFDCSSRAELQAVARLGVAGRDVMYTSNFTSAKDLRLALDLGVIINLDDVSVLDTLIQVTTASSPPPSSPGGGAGSGGGGAAVVAMTEAGGRVRAFPSLISFRLNPGVGKTEAGGTASNVLGGPGSKFGMAADTVVEAYRRAHAAGATEFGIHMMAGSCVTTGAVEYWSETLNIMADVCTRVKTLTGVGFSFVNVGGGLGIPYREDGAEAPVEEVALEMRRIVDARMTEIGVAPGQAPRLVMECGRFITGPSGFLVTRCHAVKKQHFGKTFYGVDACMAHLMRVGMYNAFHHITVRSSRRDGTEDGSKEQLEMANVVGTLCENNDWFAHDRPLPPSEAGDLFIIHDTGAHSHSMGFNYNSALRAPEVLIRTSYHDHSDGEATSDASSVLRYVDCIRRRETFETLFGHTHVPADLMTGADRFGGTVLHPDATL